MTGNLLRFIVPAILLLFVWFIVYDLWLKPDGRVDGWLTESIARSTASGMKLLGYDASYQSLPTRSAIHINGKHLLGIAHACNGLVLYALFTGFLTVFPGPVRQKVWFIPVGIISIFVVNVLRAVVLSLIKLHTPAALDFNHRYTFTLVMYSFIFLLWMIWVNRYSGVVTKPEKSLTMPV